MRSLRSYGIRTVSSMKETICWHFRYLSLSIWGILQFRSCGGATTEKALEYQIEQAKQDRALAEVKLADTRKVGAEVEALSRLYWKHLAGTTR